MYNVDFTSNNENPIERLNDFCSKANYFYKITSDTFKNGRLMTITLFRENDTFLMTKSVFTTEKEVTDANKVICAVLLDELGLGIEEEDDIGEAITDTFNSISNILKNNNHTLS